MRFAALVIARSALWSRFHSDRPIFLSAVEVIYDVLAALDDPTTDFDSISIITAVKDVDPTSIERY